MADNELKQALKLEGLEKIKALSNILGDVNKNIALREKAEKALQVAIKQTATAEQLIRGEYDKELALVKNLRDVKAEAFKKAMSDKAKERDAYFAIGTALRKDMMQSRQEMRMMREATGSIGSWFGGAVGSESMRLFQKFDELKFTFEGLGAVAEGTKGKLGSILGTVAGFGLPVAAVGAGAFYFAEQIKRWGEESDKAKAGLEDILVVVGKLDKIELLKRRVGEREKIEPSAWDMFLANFMGPASWQAKGKLQITAAQQEETAQVTERLAIEKATSDAAKERVEIAKNMLAMGETNTDFVIQELEAYKQTLMSENQIKTSLKERYAIQKEIYDLRKKQSEEAATKADIAEAHMWASAFGGKWAPRGAGMGITQSGIPGTLTGVKARPEDWAKSNAKYTKVAFEDLSLESQAFFHGMESMSQELASQISTGIGGAFRAAFGEGKNLMADLITMFASSFLGSFFTGWFGAVTSSWLPHASGGMITEPVIGVGLHSRAIHTFGERGPEEVVPRNRSLYTSHSPGGGDLGRMAASVGLMAKALANGTLRLRGKDAVLIYKANELTYNQGVM